MPSCRTCNADWSAGRWSPTCKECGGGALDHACVMCGGRCGARWERAVMDSNDRRRAHWIGGCGLPREEIDRIRQAYIDELKRSKG